MTSLSYEDIFSDFLGNITDPQIASLEQSDAYAIMSEYLHKTLANPYIRRLFSSVSLDDSILNLKFEMEFNTDENADKDFVRIILSKGMLVEWLRPQVESRINLAQFFAGKEQKFFSQSSHISELRGLYTDTQYELRRMITDRGYIYNSYLEDK